MNVPRRTRIAWLTIALPLLVAADQVTKMIATEHLLGSAPKLFWGGVFRLQYALNRGAFLGAGDSLSSDMRFLILTVGTGVLLLVIFIVVLRGSHVPKLRFASLLLILSGGVGNLIDRVAQGSVVDFMVLVAGSLRTGIFNVADVWISTGVVLLAIEMLRGDPGDTPAEARMREVAEESDVRS